MRARAPLSSELLKPLWAWLSSALLAVLSVVVSPVAGVFGRHPGRDGRGGGFFSAKRNTVTIATAIPAIEPTTIQRFFVPSR